MSLTRRNAIAATAALFAAARATTPRGAFAQASTVPEVKKATLGYIALTDASPLIIAKEKGFFAKHGMPEVEVSKQASWGATRDNLVLGGERGGIDGAHILTPMPYLMTYRARHPEQPAGADGDPGPAEHQRPGDLGGREAQGAGREAGCHAAEGCAEPGQQGRDDLPRRHPRPVAALLAGRRRIDRTRTCRPSSCRRRRWSPT